MKHSMGNEDLLMRGTMQSALRDGFVLMSYREVIKYIVGKKFLGIYPYGFQYVVYFGSDGSIEGVNNCGHYDTGRWAFDDEQQSLTVEWQRGWVSARTHVLRRSEEFCMYDVDTKKWITTLYERLAKCEEIRGFQFNV